MSQDTSSLPQYISNSPQYPSSHAPNPTPWGDSPEPYPNSPSPDRSPSPDNYLDPFAEADQFYDSLPRLPSPRPPPDPSRPPRSTARAEQQSLHLPPILPPYLFSASPEPYLDFLDFGPLDPSEQPTPRSHNTRESSVVDLTESSPSAINNSSRDSMAPSRKRKADTPGIGRASKASRGSAGPRVSKESPSVQQKVESPEMVDLVDIDDDEKYEDFKSKQQAELIRQQQLAEATKPSKLAEFQCIICMDNPTDLTVTHCGHLFCSECLHQALYAGNAKKCCPVCRTAISTALQGKDRRQPKNGVFVLEMKLMSTKRGKQPAKGTSPRPLRVR